ncbi:MAG: hypothetical protein HY226_05145 [Candidatus Vogelbacteria bacterium]|nr:hypothetical protein [Candidatus Vogelbacteria bacterium]
MLTRSGRNTFRSDANRAAIASRIYRGTYKEYPIQAPFILLPSRLLFIGPFILPIFFAVLDAVLEVSHYKVVDYQTTIQVILTTFLVPFPIFLLTAKVKITGNSMTIIRLRRPLSHIVTPDDVEVINLNFSVNPNNPYIGTPTKGLIRCNIVLKNKKHISFIPFFTAENQEHFIYYLKHSGYSKLVNEINSGNG